MPQLIVNADDFGFNKEITDGILEAHRNGVVTSTTLMVNMPAVEYAVEMSKDCPDLSVGIHVNLTAGKPLCSPSEVASLVDADGNFLDCATFMSRANRCKLESEHLERELTRQFERFEELGIKPTHADSHHHAASCVQPFFIKLKLMKQFGIDRLRTHRGWYHADRAARNRLGVLLKSASINIKRFPFRVYYELLHLICKARGIKTPTERFGFYKVVGNRPMGFNLDSVQSLLATMPSGVNELCCHPGYMSDDPLDEPEFRVQRPIELELLTDESFKSAIHDAGVQLINYRQF